MKVEHVEGNIIDMIKNHEVTAVAHGCNAFHTMGGGIAKTINEYTKGAALEVDKETLYGDINKLGTYSRFMYGNVEYYNLYTQFVTSSQVRDATVLVHWMSVYEAMKEMIWSLSMEAFDYERVAIPEIGCGLAGGNRKELDIIVKSLSRELNNKANDVELLVVKYNGE